MQKMEKKQDIGLLIIRLGTATPMLAYGIGKLIHGIDYIKGLVAAIGLPSVLGYGVYIGEIVAPVLIIIGFRTRLAGLVFAANCLCAILLAKTADIFRLNENGGWALELLAIYLLSGVALYLMGSGRLAVSTRNRWD